MAGMLPGVECARRRRVHRSGESPSLANTNGCSRRPSFCLYASNHETHQTSTFSLQRSKLNQASYTDEKLGVEARVAKDRLDERLRTQKKSQPKRLISKEGSLRIVVDDGISAMIMKELHREVYGSKKTTKTGSRKFSWAKLSWKSSDQDECAVCLERFRPGETLVHLPCAHRFHSGCMIPWLEKNAHCPCCRMAIAVVSQ
ncbi:probable E3 ubiquitin-protein ligase RHY1A [Argentina anserina]|uniref:probable E3 ubiquitin-protein ligase RHY1A n=1 Tax=Argentina anserina TaxID=57926 RepID=UPI0021766734|nr:probable E3 ubiquitin-protein ligase RHY1A [Potentilla anserina]XP_050364671.1 probable E3 ubiquitin-protein ligase RHY1A [Potentilla anserina]